MGLSSFDIIGVIVSLIILVLFIATASIGKECYNQNPTFAKTKPDNDGYLKWSIGVPVVGIFALAGMTYLAAISQPWYITLL